MAKREEHNEEAEELCRKTFGRALSDRERAVIDEVNVRIDQFAHYPHPDFLSRHRKFLHHQEGIDYFDRLYGQIGRITAEAHVKRDCKHVPKAMDYYTEEVDEYGRK